MKKITKILIAILVVSIVAVMIGLIVTGYMIGWGPFATLRYYNSVTYQISDKEYSYTREKKEIEGPNGKIVGYLYMSQKEDENQELVIFSHGYATEQWHNLNVAESLANAGISVFIFDYCGGSIHAESEGSTMDMSILTERMDLNTVIDTAKKWEGINPDKICIMGYSQGGLVAAITVAQRDDIYKLCLVYPAFSMFEEIRGTYDSVEEVPEISERLGMKIGKRYYEDILEFETNDIFQYAADYEEPVFLIHGTADEAVPCEVSIKANQAYKNSNIYLIEGAGHGFTGEDDVTFAQKAYEFFVD